MWFNTQNFTAVEKGMLNFARTAMFGNLPLRIYAESPADGATEMLSLSSDWAAIRAKANKDSADASPWEFLIADRTELTKSIIRKWSIFVIGNQIWEIEKRETPVGNFGLWRLKAKVIGNL